MSVADVRRQLNQHSGFIGLSGRTVDMRELLALEQCGHRDAALAIGAFCRRARHYVAPYMEELGGADAIVFGGGIGENCPDIRRRILSGMEWAGIQVHAEANSAGVGAQASIATPTSGVRLIVLPVDETSVMASEAAAALGGGDRGC